MFLVSAHASAESAQPLWEQLNPQQKEVLAPLAQEWNGMDAAKRKKWLGIAKRYPGMTPTKTASNAATDAGLVFAYS